MHMTQLGVGEVHDEVIINDVEEEDGHRAVSISHK